MMKKRTFLLLAIFFLIQTFCYAYQFEDYAWSSKYEDVEKHIKADGRDYKPFKPGLALQYKDNIFGEDCNIILYFTPQTRQLACIDIIWDNPDMGEDARKALARKHGQPYGYSDTTTTKDRGPSVFMYRWGSPRGERMILDYRLDKAYLTYYSGIYGRYEDETAAANSKDFNKM